MCPLPPPLCFAMQNIGEVSVGRRGWKIPTVEVTESGLLSLCSSQMRLGECPQGEGVKKYPQKKQRRILTFGGLERNIKNEYNR